MKSSWIVFFDVWLGTEGNHVSMLQEALSSPSRRPSATSPMPHVANESAGRWLAWRSKENQRWWFIFAPPLFATDTNIFSCWFFSIAEVNHFLVIFSWVPNYETCPDWWLSMNDQTCWPTFGMFDRASNSRPASSSPLFLGKHCCSFKNDPQLCFTHRLCTLSVASFMIFRQDNGVQDHFCGWNNVLLLYLKTSGFLASFAALVQVVTCSCRPGWARADLPWHPWVRVISTWLI